MKPNHKQAIEDAFHSSSNLALAYWEALGVMASMTHHPGALEEFRPQWEPIVQACLSKVLEDPVDEGSVPTVRPNPLRMCNIISHRGGADRLELVGENGEFFTIQIEDGKLGVVRSEDQ